ncbi:hypothetical protein NO1_0347 [Candidatus Termititenax aidoneus]|uniref:Replication-associated protein G2P N-terminal domain-containing protein n=1 Tax=Termititenax aidoneus TaxID=2218524 RepID=A0A388T8D8_TERA1|nr:hypothetical protein NO1_0347 [Candidatus Termititenax aidoneus]
MANNKATLIADLFDDDFIMFTDLDNLAWQQSNFINLANLDYVVGTDSVVFYLPHEKYRIKQSCLTKYKCNTADKNNVIPLLYDDGRTGFLRCKDFWLNDGHFNLSQGSGNLFITVNIPKCFNSNNIALPTNEQYRKFWEMFKDFLAENGVVVDLSDIKISRIDIALNVELPNRPPDYYVFFEENLKHHANQIRYFKGSLYIRSKKGGYLLCVYDKAKELREKQDFDIGDINLLRAELRIKGSKRIKSFGKIHGSKFTAESLFSKRNLQSLFTKVYTKELKDFLPVKAKPYPSLWNNTFTWDWLSKHLSWKEINLLLDINTLNISQYLNDRFSDKNDTSAKCRERKRIYALFNKVADFLPDNLYTKLRHELINKYEIVMSAFAGLIDWIDYTSSMIGVDLKEYAIRPP